MSWTTRLRGAGGVAAAQLGHDPARTALAVAGVALAVLAATLLAGVGIGVVATGEEQFDAADRDLWVTGDAIRLDPTAVGGFENSLYGAHEVSRELESHEDVANAVPLSFQTVYVSADGESFDTLIGTGAPASGQSVAVESGADLPPDTHYASGSYDGEMTHALLVDPETADRYDVAVGDTLYVGGTVSTARRHEFRVVGVSPTFSRFIGTPTVTMHLSELQRVTGSTSTDSATLVTVSLEDGADPAAVAEDLDAAHPELEVRTNREQLVSTLRRQAVLVASGASLVVLAVVAGLALTLNLLLSHVYSQRRELAALRSLGGSVATLSAVATFQAVAIGVTGGVLGVALAVPAAALLDGFAAAVVGFDGLVRTPPWVLGVGFSVAAVTSGVAAVAASVQIGRLSPLEQLDA